MGGKARADERPAGVDVMMSFFPAYFWCRRGGEKTDWGKSNGVYRVSWVCQVHGDEGQAAPRDAEKRRAARSRGSDE